MAHQERKPALLLTGSDRIMGKLEDFDVER